MLPDNNTTSILRHDALEAEQLGRLTDRQLDMIRSYKWFKLFVPKEYGGLELSLPEALRLEERLSWIDGSVGWVVTLCAGAGWFIKFADKGFARSILKDDNFCVAGSGAVGTADVVPGGFKINGSWKYASGSLHATAFTVNCRVDGEVKSFFLLPNEVTIRHTWNSMGMIATGSHSFEVKDQVVAKDRMFLIAREPFLELADTTLAVNISGMALRFIELSGSKAGTLDHYREKFFLRPDREASLALVKTSRDIVNDLYWQCGLSAANKDTEINRVWRNFHTAAQHSLFSRKER
jgi:alkylation response protein AidB-like acyl-CoA dehydrogenase